MVQKDRSRLVDNRGGKGAKQGVNGKTKGPGGLPSKTRNPSGRGRTNASAEEGR